MKSELHHNANGVQIKLTKGFSTSSMKIYEVISAKQILTFVIFIETHGPMGNNSEHKNKNIVRNIWSTFGRHKLMFGQYRNGDDEQIILMILQSGLFSSLAHFFNISNIVDIPIEPWVKINLGQVGMTLL